MPAKTRPSEHGSLSHRCPGATPPTVRSDPLVLGQLYALGYRPLVGFLCKQGVSYDLAHDYAMNAIIRVAEMGDRLDFDRSPLALLFRVTLSARHSRWRKDRRARPFTPTDRDSLADTSPEPVDQAARDEGVEQFRTALAAIPEPLRRVLTRSERGESRETTAALEGITLKQLDRRRVKGVRALVATCPALAAH